VANRDIWPGYDDIERVRAEMLGPHKYAIEFEGSVVGLIQWWEEDDPEYRHAGIDVALHPDWHDQRLGRDAVATMARWLIEDRGHHRVTIDPLASNERAIRCYAAVGFKPVGVMRQYQVMPDGSRQDGLLMDLLPKDLS
jgi:aminoglycoside 6'-N-acetyltransferase